MIVKANLYITDKGNLRITKQDFYPKPNELSVRLSIDVPDAFFKRPTPKANLSIPKDYLLQTDHEMAVNFIAPEVAEALKLEVSDVQDGLKKLVEAMIEEKNNG